MLFGFGSLISPESLKSTAPNAQAIKPAYIKGFLREFNLWDPLGYTDTNLDLAGIPFTALDVSKTEDSAARVNGVVFTVNQDDFKQLLIREQEYQLVETMAYDYETGTPLGTCAVFSAGKNNGTYSFDSAPQKRYLDNYLKAARSYGQKYYDEILDTTYINGRKLKQFPELFN